MILTDVENDLDVLQKYLEKLIDWISNKAVALLVALIFLFLSIKLSKWITSKIKKSLDKAGVDKGLSGFLMSFLSVVLYAIIIITVVNLLGFNSTSLITLLGSAGLAVGLALQGSLANLAGGVLILIMKPFKVGDYIIENDKKCEGTVKEINIFYTKLVTYDNKLIVIPNGNITANSIVNLSAMEYRKVDIKVNVSFDSDIEKVKTVLNEVIEQSQYVSKEHDINLFVESFGDSAIIMGVRFYVLTDNYWAAKWDTNEKIKIAFDKNNIVIPHNQLDVKIKANS